MPLFVFSVNVNDVSMAFQNFLESISVSPFSFIFLRLSLYFDQWLNLSCFKIGYRSLSEYSWHAPPNFPLLAFNLSECFSTYFLRPWISYWLLLAAHLIFRVSFKCSLLYFSSFSILSKFSWFLMDALISDFQSFFLTPWYYHVIHPPSLLYHLLYSSNCTTLWLWFFSFLKVIDLQHLFLDNLMACRLLVHY